MRSRLHALLDFTSLEPRSKELEAAIAWAASAHGLANQISHATVLLPPEAVTAGISSNAGWHFAAGTSSIQEANAALEYAGNESAHLLLSLGPTLAGPDAVGMLIEAFEIDPHFGVTVPRTCDGNGNIFKLSPELGDPTLDTLPRRLLTAVPPYYILPEVYAPFFLIRDTLVSNLPPLNETFDTLAGAVQLYLCNVRRAGFRTAVINRSVIPVPVQSERQTISASKADTRKLHTLHPDVGKAKSEFTEHSLHLGESLLGRALSNERATSRTLLLDLRGVPHYMNGTAEAVLALCDAMHSLKTDWEITVWAEATTIECHRLEQRYPDWSILQRDEAGYFTAAFRPSQPWHLSTMSELHQRALLNFFAMLDTISWDILFEAPRGLGVFWDFMSQYADGLLYNSFDTRHHVVRRFPSAEQRAEFVFHHSFHPKDYADPAILGEPQSDDYIFVIGNSYDHKHLSPTVDLLSAAFPFEKLKVLGLKKHINPRVEVLESGHIPSETIERLFAQAKLILFPSFYEGFGLPTIKGLSYGRTVLARRSSLLDELAGYYRGPGKLLDFATPQELIETVGKVVHGCHVDSLALGGRLGDHEEPKTWSAVAAGVLQFFEQKVSQPDTFQWPQRERALRQIHAYST